MKRSLLLVISLLISCSNQEDNGLIGTWKMTEAFASPGGAGGIENLTPIESSKIIRFGTLGRVSSNGDLFDMSNSTEKSTFGTYLSDENKIISKDGKTSVRYELNNSSIIFYYLCFEACIAKFERIN